MVEVTIKLPDNVARSFGETADLRSRRVMEDTAIQEYRAGRLSQRQAGEMLGLDYWQTERFFTEHKVPLNYSLNDLEADRATLDEILGRK
jgi:predicted HTH domain antitoxin